MQNRSTSRLKPAYATEVNSLSSLDPPQNRLGSDQLVKKVGAAQIRKKVAQIGKAPDSTSAKQGITEKNKTVAVDKAARNTGNRNSPNGGNSSLEQIVAKTSAAVESEKGMVLAK